MTRLKPVLLDLAFGILGLIKSDFDLIIVHFYIREKLIIILCDKLLIPLTLKAPICI